MIKQTPTTNFYAKTGALVRTRPLQDSDTPFLIDIFEHMSSESRYQRFHQTLDHLSEQRIQLEAAQIAQADPITNFGLIAFTLTEKQMDIPVGVARWVEIGYEEAEIAISIRDDFQGQGIGTQLLNQLIDQAKQAGYKRLTAEIQNTNSAIWRILNNLPYLVTQYPEGNESKIMVNLAVRK